MEQWVARCGPVLKMYKRNKVFSIHISLISNFNMASSGPTPVVFKSLISTNSSGEFSHKNVHMTHFSVCHFKPLDENEYFMLTDNDNPSHPLKLYKSGMKNLIKALPFAMKEAARLEQDNLPDNELFEAGIINKYGTMKVRLVLSTFRQKVFIWLRLYTMDDNGNELPTKTGVRFSKDDNIGSLENLIEP